MNTQEYISSGIVESYVLGLASPEERSEFEQMCRQYAEVLHARTAFELTLEKQAIENAITPPANLKNKIFTQLNTSSPGKVVAMQRVTVKSMNWLKYTAAACVIVLAGSIYLNISLSNKNKSLQSSYDNTVSKLNDMEKDAEIIVRPGIKMASMKGQEISPASYATVYWDTTSQDVYLMINNMPKPASDKQYQLWAFLNGQPIDMGLIEITEKPLQLYRLKKARSAEAFAITLEMKDRNDVTKPGGEVYVKGNL